MKIEVIITPTAHSKKDYRFTANVDPQTLKDAGDKPGLIMNKVRQLSSWLLLLAESNGDLK